MLRLSDEPHEHGAQSDTPLTRHHISSAATSLLHSAATIIIMGSTMGIAGHLSTVNWFAVVVATVAAFLLGALWYSRAIFGLKWMQEIGLTEESMKQGNMAKIFGTTFVLQFFAATALAVFLGPNSNWLLGLHAGSLIGLVWVATSYGITYLFEQRTMRLFLINAGYYVVLYSIMGTILGAWPK